MPLYAEAPEYRRSPLFQNHRATAASATANRIVPPRAHQLSRPASACAGIVVANATGTMKVSAKRIHPG